MPAEDQFCLLLARGRLSSEEQARVLQFLATPLQWPAILERACSHQVYPLLYRNLRDLEFQDVPVTVQAELKGLFLANALRNQLLAEELARLLKILGEAGIRVVPLKGVALAQSLYGDVAARVCADIDILVPPASVAPAIDLILASGYRTESSDPYFSKLVLRHGRHFHATREDHGVSIVVELHWTLVQHSSKDDAAVDDLWAEARSQTCFGAPAFSLSPEWEFLYLSIHAADHEWQCLKWLVDIHELASSGLVDWQRTMNKAETFDLGLVTRQTLAASSFLLGTQLPSACATATPPEGVQLFSHAPLPAGAAQSAFDFRHMRLLKRPLDKVRYVATVFLAPQITDLEFVRLPRHLAFLYYFIRPLRLACKWVGRILGNNRA